MPEVPDTARAPHEKVQPFGPGAAYRVGVGMGRPVDLVGDVGEEIRDVVGGDWASLSEGQDGPWWEVKQGAAGLRSLARPHIYVTATGDAPTGPPGPHAAAVLPRGV